MTKYKKIIFPLIAAGLMLGHMPVQAFDAQMMVATIKNSTYNLFQTLLGTMWSQGKKVVQENPEATIAFTGGLGIGAITMLSYRVYGLNKQLLNNQKKELFMAKAISVDNDQYKKDSFYTSAKDAQKNELDREVTSRRQKCISIALPIIMPSTTNAIFYKPQETIKNGDGSERIIFHNDDYKESKYYKALDPEGQKYFDDRVADGRDMNKLHAGKEVEKANIRKDEEINDLKQGFKNVLNNTTVSKGIMLDAAIDNLPFDIKAQIEKTNLTITSERKSLVQAFTTETAELKQDLENVTTILPLFSAVIFSGAIRRVNGTANIKNNLVSELIRNNVWNKISKEKREILETQLTGIAEKVMEQVENRIVQANEEKEEECKKLRDAVESEKMACKSKIEKNNARMVDESIRAEEAEKSNRKLTGINEELAEKVRRYEKNTFIMNNASITDSVRIELDNTVILGEENEKKSEVSTKPHVFGNADKNGIRRPRSNSNENIYYIRN